MQHAYVLKKVNFDLLNQYPRVLERGGGGGGGFCMENICYHVGAFMIPFN